MVGRKNVYISHRWAAMLPTLRNTALDDYYNITKGIKLNVNSRISEQQIARDTCININQLKSLSAIAHKSLSSHCPQGIFYADQDSDVYAFP